MKMKKVLVVAYGFPPVGGAGIQRPVKFVKYFRDFEWEPVVLTVANPSVPILDESMLDDIPPSVRIYRAKTLEPSYTFKQKVGGGSAKGGIKSWAKAACSSLLLPDIQVLWWPGLIRELIFVLRKEKPDCVFVTAPPFSSLVPTVILGRIFRVPVVVDFRDEWVFARQNLEHANKGSWARLTDYLMEKLVIRLCTKFTAATQAYVESIIRRHYSGAGKGIAITNGFDEADFQGLTRSERDSTARKVILYTGTIWKATSLAPFFQAMSLLLERDPGVREKIEVRLIGRFVEDEKNWPEESEFSGIVHACGYMEHRKLLEEMVNADLLLLTLSDLPGADRIIPGKTFEYFAAGLPILALVPMGEVFGVLGDHSLAEVAHPCDTEKIVGYIKNFVRGNVNAVSFNADLRFSRRHLTKNLAHLFDVVIGTKKTEGASCIHRRWEKQ